MTAEDLARELSSIETACGRDDGDAPGDPLCLLRVVEGLAPETCAWIFLLGQSTIPYLNGRKTKIFV